MTGARPDDPRLRRLKPCFGGLRERDVRRCAGGAGVERYLHLAPPGLRVGDRRECSADRLSVAPAPGACLVARHARATPAAPGGAARRMAREYARRGLLGATRHRCTRLL